MTEKLDIGVDMDSVTTMLVEDSLLPRLNEALGLSLTVLDLTHFHIEKVVGEQHTELVRSIIRTPGSYRNPRMTPGAEAALRLWHEQGHNVYIVTSPGDYFGCIPEKAEWLDEKLPFLSSRRRVFTSAKHTLDMDVWVDDGPHNVKAIRAEAKRRRRPQPFIATPEWAYHRGRDREAYDLIAPSCEDTIASWGAINRAVQEIASARG